ncbi:MAG: TIGR01777 family protein [Rickettsiaceae bacterium]|nr:TIGR01777 family protein [Rickettsiaceae bacterium]
MNFLITGGTGFIGNQTVDFFSNQGHKITILVHKNKAIINKSNITVINNLSEIAAGFPIDIIINLAGTPISKKWTKSYKVELINSRINTTKNLINVISKLKNKPKLLISASAIGYYGSHNDNHPLTEDAKFHDGFTHQLCKAWENEAKEANKYGVRTCIARFGIVLGKNGGALEKMLLPFKLGLGGKIASGKQIFSWVHLEDVIRVFDFFITNKNTKGIYNVTAPAPVTNEEFTKALGKTLNRFTILGMPAFIIKILFGEMGEELLLKGQYVVPQRLIDAGFKFYYNNIDQALTMLINDRK